MDTTKTTLLIAFIVVTILAIWAWTAFVSMGWPIFIPLLFNAAQILIIIVTNLSSTINKKTRNKLNKSENSGFTNDSKEQILKQSKYKNG